jgi:hypothetical protein
MVYLLWFLLTFFVLPYVFPLYYLALILLLKKDCYYGLAWLHGHWAYRHFAAEYREYAQHVGMPKAKMNAFLRNEKPAFVAEHIQQKLKELEEPDEF